jgi:hypothetical protein
MKKYTGKPTAVVSLSALVTIDYILNDNLGLSGIGSSCGNLIGKILELLQTLKFLLHIYKNCSTINIRLILRGEYEKG